MMLNYRPSKPIIPPNTGRAGILAGEAAKYEKAYRQSAAESAKVSGVLAHWYFRKRSGRPCSCKLKDEPGGVLTPDGDMPAEMMEAIQRGETAVNQGSGISFGSGRYGKKADVDLITNEKNEIDEDSGTVDYELDEDAPEPQDPNKISVNILSSHAVNCGVCKGTGFIGGYDPHNGARIVISAVDAQNTKGWELEDAEISKSDPPWRVQNLMNRETDWAKLRFSASLPKYVNHIMRVSVFDDKTPLKHGKDWRLMYSDTEIYEIRDPSHLRSRCTGKPTDFILAFKPDWTHMEMQFVTGEYLHVDMAGLAKERGPSHFENVDSTSISVPPVITNVGIGDLFVLKTPSSLWTVDSVDFEPGFENRRIGFECSANRITTKFEPYHVQSPWREISF